MASGSRGNVDSDLPKGVWLLKTDGVKKPDRKTKQAEQFCSGVCVSSNGLILTCVEGFVSPRLEDSAEDDTTFDFDSVYGCTPNSQFEKLKLVWEDDGTNFLIYQVEDGMKTDYDCCEVSEVCVDKDSKLVSVAINGDQPFSQFDCYTPAPAPATKRFFPIYGKTFVEDVKDYPDCLVTSTTAGSPIFHEREILVGMIYERRGRFCRARPVNPKLIKRAKKEIKEKRDQRK